MIRTLAVMAALVGSSVIGAEPRPLLVVQERDPWRMVMGSDSAQFAIYDDGSVVYLRSAPTPESPYARREVKSPEAEVRRVLGFDIADAEDTYELTSATDQVTTTVWTPSKQVRVYGDWRGRGDRPSRKTVVPLPAELSAALSRIGNERKVDGDPWLPESIEVMMWPYESAPQDSIAWPQEWPGLDDPKTLSHEDRLFTVYLPARSLPELKRFLATRKPRDAVLIGGRKMSASYRFPFVGESEWME